MQFLPLRPWALRDSRGITNARPSGGIFEQPLDRLIAADVKFRACWPEPLTKERPGRVL
jgi:hypothetical protein